MTNELRSMFWFRDNPDIEHAEPLATIGEFENYRENGRVSCLASTIHMISVLIERAKNTLHILDIPVPH